MTKLQKLVKEFCEELKVNFCLHDYTMVLQFMEKNNGSSICDISMDTTYIRFKIQVYPIFEEEEPEDQASSLIHEFIHTLNLPIYNLFDELKSGKFITEAHANELNEQATCRGESMMRNVLTNNHLQKARLKFIKASNALRSRKQSLKLTQNT